ncbi:hypothetical protein NKG05_23565 [Oerskovia sp. M15]
MAHAARRGLHDRAAIGRRGPPSRPLEPGGGGSITAALFLREFTGGLPWAHLDIAGPARATSPRHEVTEGRPATGPASCSGSSTTWTEAGGGAERAPHPDGSGALC